MMKPKLKHFIPFYGLGLYFRDYFNEDRRDAKEAAYAYKFMMTHIVVEFLIIVAILTSVI